MPDRAQGTGFRFGDLFEVFKRKPSRKFSSSTTTSQSKIGRDEKLARVPSPDLTMSLSLIMDDPPELLIAEINSIGDNIPYVENRRELLREERDTCWDEPARLKASEDEKAAQAIVYRIREAERINPQIYGNLPGEEVPAPGTHDMGGRFLANKQSIDASELFKIALRMPKGSHLHLHFNSELPPEILLPHARATEMQNTMYIRSTRPLLKGADLDLTEVVFSVLPETTPKANCFDEAYNPSVKDKGNSPWMLWSQFRKRFQLYPDARAPEQVPDLDAAERWVREKMVITIQQGISERQTHNGAWACFNQGTRAFKGLLNYEGIYRWYIGQAIDSMIRDGVMYAELRPMLLDKSIPSNDGKRQLTHQDQMNIICEEVQKKQAALQANGMGDRFPFGLKIIYCTPRSIPRARMQTELNDCIKLKLAFPKLICGFDLVGAEDRPNHVGFYADLLLAFTKTCHRLDIKIPFMFHAGETLLDTGGSADPDNSNLYDSLLLEAKRIGHGYALLKHPLLIERYKRQNICLELCPISNELLHLCSNVREHPYPALLAAGLHCTLNADNPSLFRSSLSYEFYQVMVGDPRMTIHGWKQLAEWSIEHSCLEKDEIERGLQIFHRDWKDFCAWIVREFSQPK